MSSHPYKYSEKIKEYNRNWQRANGQRIRNSLKKRYNKYKHNAIKRGLLFPLTLAEFQSITSKPCYLCSGYNRQNTAFTGIDRIDSTIGYITSNIAPCCTSCNMFKGTKTLPEFLAIIYKIADYQRKSRTL